VSSLKGAMTEFVEGNILEADAQALVNTVNTVGVMGKGIALQFKKAFPEIFADYERACARGEVVMGRMHVYDRGSLLNPRYIINFPTKKHWKGKSRMANIEAGLEDLIRQVKALGITSIAVPPLGCGHGGLKWLDVRRLIVEAFEELPEVRALIYEPTGAPAPEKQVIRTERPEMTLSRANVLGVLNQYCVLGYQLTLLEVQKLLYFLQVSGEDLRLRFTKEAYGPYADNLRHVLHRFEGHFTLGFGEGRNSPDTPIRLLPEALDEARKLTAEHEQDGAETKKRLQRVSELIEGYESPYGMELLSSVHWVAIHPEEHATDLDSVVQAILNWSDRKARVMKRDHIRIAWERLRQERWI
jgi:O-acetyl-ADP-ribose deacetylase (regulator of RNase III)